MIFVILSGKSVKCVNIPVISLPFGVLLILSNSSKYIYRIHAFAVKSKYQLFYPK